MRKFVEKIYRFTRVYGTTAAGVIAVVGVLVYEKYQKSPVYSSWTTAYDPSVKWDYNWDKREPDSLVKPLKDSATDDEKLKHKDKVTAKVSSATRHIILIRHGQYFDTEKLDINRKLTPLGREQANMTGQRLAELNYPFSKLICSTMTRARETADIIHKHLPELPREEDSLLREGAPIPPEPPSGNWRPEAADFDAEKLMNDISALKKVMEQHDKKIKALEKRLDELESSAHNSTTDAHVNEAHDNEEQSNATEEMDAEN